jgi:hypothetical protein
MPAPLGEGRDGVTVPSAREGDGGGTTPSRIPAGRTRCGDGGGSAVDPSIRNSGKELRQDLGKNSGRIWEGSPAGTPSRWRWNQVVGAAGTRFPIGDERWMRESRDGSRSTRCDRFVPLEATRAAQRHVAGCFRGAALRRSGLSRPTCNLNAHKHHCYLSSHLCERSTTSSSLGVLC